MGNLKNKSERSTDQSIFEQEIGKWLRKTRLSNNHINPLTERPIITTQTKLAKHLGVTFQQIQKYESGINGLGLYKFTQCCVFFNKCPRDVLEIIQVEVWKKQPHPIIEVNEVSFADRESDVKKD